MDVETSDTDPALEQAQRAPMEPVAGAAETPLERSIAAIWEEVLQRAGIGRTEDFFDLGGTSLDLIRVFARVNKQYGLSLNGSVFDDEATIARLASCVEAAMRVPM